jgi:hypothetical protein
MKDCFIFDLDGTLADCEHRRHLVEAGKWDEFYLACDQDKPMDHIVKVASILADACYPIFILSGRSDIAREKTETWLRNLNGSVSCYDRLYMRKHGDYTPDDVLKKQWLDEIRAEGWNVVMAFDDRDKVVAMWRANGVPCAQVAPGDF